MSARLSEGRARLLVAAVVLAAVVLRLRVLPAAGFSSDVGTFQAWAERLADGGPRAFYEPGYFADYPPGFLYVLWLLGVVFDGEPLRLAVKAVSIPFDIGIALVLAAVTRRQLGRAAGVAAAAIWMLAPGPIIDGPLWGQTDAVGTLPLVVMAAAAGSGRWVAAGVLAGVAVMVKPQFGLGGLVLAAVVALELLAGRRRALLALAAAAATVVALGVPFGVGPLDLVGLVRTAAAGYPYTSLYAFNIWALVADFWKPDDAFVVFGAALLLLGIAASTLVLRRARDTRAILLALGLAAMAFYFLPTRAHERYLFPAFALLLPLAIERRRTLVPYLALGATFATTLVYALSRYPQNELRMPDAVETTLFGSTGVFALIALMLLCAVLLVVGLIASKEPAPVREHAAQDAPASERAPLPAGLGPGRRPGRRELVLALLFVLAMLLTRGYRVDQPRGMYFDEVYHARTAFELLAQREPYEWTHPHLAKEIMALGILLFGDDRVVAREDIPVDLSAFTVSDDGVRAFAQADGTVSLRDRGGRPLPGGARLAEPVRALAFDGPALYALTDSRLVEVPRSAEPPASGLASYALPFPRAQALHVSGGHVAVGGPLGLSIAQRAGGDWTRVAVATVALTGRADGTEFYALDPAGAVHVLDGATGAERRLITMGPGTAVALAEGPHRLFVARAEAPELEVADLEGGAIERVPLANERTGAIGVPAMALAVVPRTQFLYAATGDGVVVVETHGASPFAAIAAGGDRLAVDGAADELLVAGREGQAARIDTGRHGLAWRLPGVVAGALLALFTVLLAARLFASRLVPVFVGLAFLLDGSTFAQARIGMNDVYVALFIVAGWYFVVAAHGPRRSARIDVLAAGILLGLALATKWVGAYAIAGVLVASLAQTARGLWRDAPGSGGPLDLIAGKGRNAAWLFCCFALLPAAIYWLSYRTWFGGPTAPYGWDLVELTRQMYQYHSGLTSPHPAGSPWWSWPLVLKPVYWYYGQSAAGENAYIYDAGNIALFWMALPATVWLAVAAVRSRSFRLGFAPFVLLTQFVAWVPITRVLFFYHFFTALPFYLLALAAALAALWERGSRAHVLAGFGAATFAAVFFYPFVSGLPVPAAQASIFFVLPTWQYDCQFYSAEGGFHCDLGSAVIEPGAVLSRVALAAAVTAVVLVPFAIARLGAIRSRGAQRP